MPDSTGFPQPYQKTILAAIESSGRLETYSERWNREKSESRRAFAEALKRTNDAASALAAAFAPIGQAARRAQAAIEPLARLILEAERGAPLGRKRRARRARGRKIKARRPYSSAALAMAAAFKADAERAAAFRPFAERLAADFARQAEALLRQRP
jgi:hypothetical protein